jgi:hypothetical protein
MKYRFTTKHVGGTTIRDSRRGPWHVIEVTTGVVVSSHRTHRQARITARVLNLPESEPHTVGQDPPTPENDPVGRFRP